MRHPFAFALILLLSGLVETQAQPKNELPQSIKLDELQFDDPGLGDTVRRLYAASEKMAPPEWVRRPHVFHVGDIAAGYTYWYTFPEPDPRNGHAPLNYHGPKELNCVSVGVFSDAAPGGLGKIAGTRLDARWKPADTGWAARMAYRTYQGKKHPTRQNWTELFECYWSYYPEPKQKKPRPPAIDLQLHDYAQWQKHFNFGNTEKPSPTLYLIQVETKNYQSLPRNDVVEKDIAAIFSSPESLRDYLVRVHTALLNKANEDLARGKGVRQALYLRPPLPPRDEKMAAKGPTVSNRKLTEGETEQILQAAREEIDEKIATVNEYYKELYAAALKTFPIRDSVAEKAKK